MMDSLFTINDWPVCQQLRPGLLVESKMITNRSGIIE